MRDVGRFVANAVGDYTAAGLVDRYRVDGFELRSLNRAGQLGKLCLKEEMLQQLQTAVDSAVGQDICSRSN